MKPPIIYLDQFAWIALARSRLGKEHSSHLKSTRSRLLAAANSGEALFPLSLVHYLETWKRSSPQQRAELAAEMGLLSGFVTLAPPQSLWRAEIEHALHRHFGKPSSISPIEFLGRGMAFAFDHPDFAGKSVTPNSEDFILREWATLASFNEKGEFSKENLARIEHASNFADVETANSVRLKGWMVDAREKSQRFRVHTLVLFEREITSALIGNGIEVSEFEALGADGMEQLVADIPSLWILTELRRNRFANPSQGFNKSDLNDLRALAIAVNYCEVVVADKAWVHAIRQTGLADKYKTFVTSNLQDVPGLLDRLTGSD